MNFISNLKALVLGIIATVSTAIAPMVPVTPNMPTRTSLLSATASTVPNSTPVTTPASGNPSVTSIPSPLNENINYDIKGTYSYLGVSVKYSFRVPKNGGEFSGNIEGACQASVAGNYTENSGEILGVANGNCSIVFVKYKGAINFKGILYPADKKLVIQVENAHLQPITLNYN